jgi:curved DNA-binding protein CbpA
MGNQAGKPNVYQQYYDAMQGKSPMPTGELDVNPESVDPYEVLGVSKQFTWEELKNSYHRLARLVHPDKGGSEKLFNMVTDCFRKLAYEYKSREENKPHHVLKKESQHYHEKHDYVREQPNPFDQRTTMPPPPMVQENSQFNERFNQIFDEFKLEDEETRGYGHMMMASSKNRDDIHIEQKMKKFNNDSFNAEFNRIPIRQQVVKYKEPEALVLTKNIAFTEIGQQSGDFTYNDPSAKSGLFYTDYMQAYDEGNQRLIDPTTVKRKDFKNVEQYEAYRSKTSNRRLTAKEMQMMAQQKQMEEEREKERLERIRQKDEIYGLQHEKIKQKLLQR